MDRERTRLQVEWGGAGAGTINVTETRGGCSGTAAANVAIGNDVTPVVSANGPLALCPGESVTLMAPGGYAAYLWSDGATTRSIVVHDSGVYSVYVRDTGGCAGTSAGCAVTIYPPPTAGITLHGDTLTANTAVSYQWSINGGAIPGATSQSYIALQHGQYTVTITDSDGCTATAAPVAAGASVVLLYCLALPGTCTVGVPVAMQVVSPDTAAGVIDSLVFDLHYNPAAMLLQSAHSGGCLAGMRAITQGDARITLSLCGSPRTGALCSASFMPLEIADDTTRTQFTIDSIVAYPPADSIATTGCTVSIVILPACGIYPVIFTTGATSLGQNYPNPFAGTTLIHVTLAKSDIAGAVLNIYNMLGERVAELTNQLTPNGTITFAAGTLSAGVYSYVLQTSGGRWAREMFIVQVVEN